MIHHRLFLFAASGILAVGLSSVKAEVVIHEIMYHPSSESPDEEFIELHNTGPGVVDVSGWQITSGIDFTIPGSTSIPDGGFLVVAADAAAFAAKYPAVTPVVAGWTGILSNSSNRINLRDALGTLVDEVKYTDDGDWATRQLDVALDYGHRGWGWDSTADGGGSSLELIHAEFDNSSGQNWSASSASEGTPGAVNSTAAADIAPVILEVGHFPLVPGSGDPVHVTARLSDDYDALDTAELHYRVDGDPSFTALNLMDDGLHGDSLAGDGVFGATLPVQSDGTIIEFYLEAADTTAHSRTWPAPAIDELGVPGQSANCLYQVEDTVHAEATPIYRLVMRAADRTELTRINTNSPPISGTDQTRSGAKMNASFISQTGVGVESRYRVGVRNRGESSRKQQPQSLRVNFLEEETWDGVVGINLNTQHTPYQLLGSAVCRKAGLTASRSRAVRLRVNGSDPAAGGGSPAYGFYVANEVIDSNFADEHYPLDSGGNIYRAKQVIYNGSSSGGDLSDWSDDPDPTLADPAPYRVHYFKRSNASEDEWSDLIGVTQMLAKGQSPTLDNPTWDADYATEVASVVDVTEWMRFFAANTIASNTETNLSTGRGDDYLLYTGELDIRARLIPYDFDSLFGRESSSATKSLWIMCQNDILPGDPPGPLNPFMKHPEFAPVYFSELVRMIEGAFAPVHFDPLVDEVLGGLVDPSVVTSIKSFNGQRTAWIAGQIPRSITVTDAPATQDGYPHVTSSSATLGGTADALSTRSVKVNGVAATWTAWTARWEATGIGLLPGLNRVLIQSFDGNGAELESLGYDVWYDDGSVQAVAGNLTVDTTWTAAAGPYELTSSLIVDAGVTLTIEPGTSVYLDGGVDLTIASGGLLIAEGTESSPIRFARPPGSGSAWGTLTINGGAGSPESRIAHARFDGNGSPAIDVNGGDVVFDYLGFGNTDAQYLSLDGASFVVSHCHFPKATSSFELVHGTQGIKSGGRGIIRRCYFGEVNGYKDSLDFTGGKRPAAILQLLENVFAGSGDDLIDLDGADAWVEGNIFLHCHKNGAPDSAAAISGGHYSSVTSEVTIVGNLFFDVDHALTAKQGNFYTFLNNTVVRQTLDGGLDVDGGVINMRDPIPDPPTTWGDGCVVAGNIITDVEKLIREYDPAETSVTLDTNLLPFAWSGPGSGNTLGDPLFVHRPTVDETDFPDWESAQVLREWLALLPGSPALGSGPGGRDLGGVIPLGVHVSGVPLGTTDLESAILAISPLVTAGVPWDSGFTHYRWSLDGGPWSAETPVANPISLSGLSSGDHYVEVSGKNDAASWQDDPDFGDSGTVTLTATWTVDPGYTPPAASPMVRINEVLVKNSETLGYGLDYPDLIELHNAGNATADLAGWGLSDDPLSPFLFAFPGGTTLAPGAYMLVHASSSVSVPSPKTGFGLKSEGETLTLTRSAAAGGGVADSIAFGAQLADYSIGRRPTDGSWDLCFPSFGSANRVAPRAEASVLRINEWLASSGVLFSTDFIELYNPSTLPVDIGLGYLTDNPTEWPDRHQLRQLTFVAPAGFALFKADGDPQDGPDHLGFRLSASQGEIGLFDSALGLIDCILYGPQTTGVSQGRSPNGASTLTFFPQPSPGGSNPDSSIGNTTIVTELIPIDGEWSYLSSSTDLQGVFEDPLFDDSGWSSGEQLLFIENSSLASPSGFVKTTAVPGNPSNSNKPYRTTYFRRHFTFDGPLGNVELKATVMVDDGAVIYLNGEEALRIRMEGGPVAYNTFANATVDNASEQTVTIPTDHLLVGDNVIAVEVHQVSEGSSDVVLGMQLNAERSTTLAAASVVINEVLVDNQSLANPDSSVVGWIELHNPADEAADIGDMSLSDSFTDSRRWVFAPGTMIPAGGALVVHCDPLSPASSTNTALDLSGTSDSVHLFDALVIGGGMRDSISFGQQLPDLSIGRSPNATGAFILNVPTRGALNQAAALAPATALHLNEWLASASSGGDWFEIYNTSSQPVLLGGHYLTDKLSDKTKHAVPPLTFLAGSGDARWLRFRADSNGGEPGHVGFSLKALGEELGIFSASGVQIDAIAFGVQTMDVSEGSYPDGSATINTMPPTPGAANMVFAPDGDGDNMPDAWEDANGLDSGFAGDAILDADFDGQSNYDEFIAGTDPQDRSSRLAITPDRDINGRPLLRFDAVAGHTYTILWSADLSGVWTRLTDIQPQAIDTVIEVTDTDPAALPRRFYRLVTPAQP